MPKPKPLQTVAPIVFAPREVGALFVPPLPTSQVYTALKFGRLKSHRIGLRSYVTDDEIRAWVKARPEPKRKKPRRRPAATTTEPAAEPTEGYDHGHTQ